LIFSADLDCPEGHIIFTISGNVIYKFIVGLVKLPLLALARKAGKVFIFKGTVTILEYNSTL